MRTLVCVVGLALLAACAEKDTQAPPKPYLDPYQSPTSDLSPILSGVAERGSHVVISGSPAGDIALDADQVSGQWWSKVPLRPNATTNLAVTAADAAGNVSEPATVEWVHDSRPRRIVLSFIDSSGAPTGLARAGEPVGALVRLFDAFGQEVTDTEAKLQFAPALPAYSGAAPCNQSAALMCDPAAPASCSHTFIACNVSGVPRGELTFTASVGSLAATARLVVSPAPARKLSGFGFAPATTPPTSSATVSAGATASYVYQAQDVYGNAATDPVTVATNAPGAVILDDGTTGQGSVSNLSYPGGYFLKAYVAGAGEVGSLSLTVGAGPAATIQVGAGSTLAAPNGDVTVFAVVRDAFANQLPCTTASLARVTWLARPPTAGQGPVGGSPACANGAFTAVFRFAAQGAYAIEATYADATATPPVSVAGSTYVQVLGFDTTPPTLSIPPASLRVNGSLCALSGTPPVCVVAPGDFVEFQVVADDNVSLSEVAFTAFFSTAGANGSVRSRTVLVASNAALPLTQSFSFSVPGAAFLEDVPLVALAVDGAGNRATTSNLVLRVNFGTYGGRVATIVARDLGGGILAGPEDVAVDAAGNVFVANGGNADVLRIASGSAFPTVFASSGTLNGVIGGFSPGFVTLDTAGNVYLTDRGGSQDVVRLSSSGSAATDWVRYTDGAANLRGLDRAAASFAKGLVQLDAAPLDGDRVTVGAVVYELDNNATCPSTSTCVTVPAGITQANAAAALAGCIASGTGCTLNGVAAAAHPLATASVAASGAPPAVVVAARAAGAPGNAIALGTTAVGRLSIYQARTTLAEGAEESVLAGQEAGGTALRSTVFRFPVTLGAGPSNETANVGAFDTSSGAGNWHEHWGVAVRGLATASTRNLRDFAVYAPDRTQGTTQLRGVRFVDAAAGAPVFNTPGGGGRQSCPSCIRDTSDTQAPYRQFSRLWDVVVDASGCLLVSDDGNGSIYAVDARDPSVATPLVSLVASGLPNPRGLAFDGSGNLLVAVQGADAVVRIGRSTTTANCF